MKTILKISRIKKRNTELNFEDFSTEYVHFLCIRIRFIRTNSLKFGKFKAHCQAHASNFKIDYKIFEKKSNLFLKFQNHNLNIKKRNKLYFFSSSYTQCLILLYLTLPFLLFLVQMFFDFLSTHLCTLEAQKRVMISNPRLN